MNPLFTHEGMPTELAQTVSLFSKSGQQEEVGAAKSITTRMPVLVYASIKAISEHSGLSINRVMVQLLRVGLDAVGENLPSEDSAEIDARRRMILMEFADLEHDGEQVGD